MGEKLGLNGVDNARIKFTDLVIPRESLLNKYSDVDPQGNFTSKIAGKRARFLKVADRLLSGRLCIAAMSISASKLGLAIAITFSNKRMVMGSSGKSDALVSAFGLFKLSVYPLLARTIILNLAFNRIK